VGNYEAILTGYIVRRIMEHVGIKPERFSLDWASAAEAPLFVELITKFTNQIRELGAIGKPEELSQEELKFRLAAARSVVESLKLRSRFGKLAQDLRELNDYSSDLIEAKMAEKVNQAIVKEIDKHMTQRT
jgi:F420-non-reducing hydrogenase iron-sulfur subunit